VLKDFHEAMLQLKVPAGLGKVYKKAIEAENNPNTHGQWSGNHVQVEVFGASYGYVDYAMLRINIISHTLPNLKETVSWYESMGCKVLSTNYKERK
jgi:hypothetical protein